jgi:hypothetical protein
MDSFFKKHMSSFDEDDAINYILRQMNHYQREQGGSSGGQSNRHEDGENNYRKLAVVYEMIEDFFEAKGLDPRSFIESSRRGR